MALPFIGQLLVGVGLQILGFLLSPKPKQPKPPAVEDLEDPTAEAGRPIPVIFGSVTLQSPNLIGAWNKEIVTREMRSSKK